MEKSKLRLAIVGKNLYSCVAALHLSDHLGSNLSWFQTLKDPELASSEQYLVLTPLQRHQLKIPIDHETLSDNPQIFIGSHRHYPIEHVLRFLRNELTDCPYLRTEHSSVLAKAIAAGLWNDLNPAVLDKTGAPRSDWIREVPPTAKDWESGAFSMIRRDQLFRSTEKELLIQKVRVDFEKKRILGIDRSSFNRGIRLVFNAPFGSDEFDALLWTSVLYSIKDEGEKKKQADTTSVAQSIGFWKTYGTDLDSHLVGFLPPLSLWIGNDAPGREFRSTGLLQSGGLKRVVCVANPDGKTHHLQIQALHFYDNPREYARPDEFLWEFCPFLRSHVISFRKSRAEENLVFRSPFSAHLKLGHRFDFWTGGMDCAFSKVPKFQWGIDSRRQKREETQPPSVQT